MKTNLKVLMFTLFVGLASSSVNAKWGSEYITAAWNYSWGKTKSGYTYVTTLQNWKDHKCYFAAGTVATVAVAAGVAYCVCKAMKSKKDKQNLITE